MTARTLTARRAEVDADDDRVRRASVRRTRRVARLGDLLDAAQDDDVGDDADDQDRAAAISALLNEPVRATMMPVIVGAKKPATLLRKFMIPPTWPVLLAGAISAGIDQPTGAWNEMPATATVIQNDRDVDVLGVRRADHREAHHQADDQHRLAHAVGVVCRV